MPLSAPVSVDALQLVIDYLLSVPEVTAIAGQRIGVSLDRGVVAAPSLRISRIGGTRAVRRWLDAPRIQVEAWAPPGHEQDAHDLAATARAALDDLPGAHTLGVVTGVEDDGGFAGPGLGANDPETNDARVLFGIRAFIHPLP